MVDEANGSTTSPVHVWDVIRGSTMVLVRGGQMPRYRPRWSDICCGDSCSCYAISGNKDLRVRVKNGFLVWGRVRIKIRIRVGVAFNVSVYHSSNCRRSKYRTFRPRPEKVAQRRAGGGGGGQYSDTYFSFLQKKNTVKNSNYHACKYAIEVSLYMTNLWADKQKKVQRQITGGATPPPPPPPLAPPLDVMIMGPPPSLCTVHRWSSSQKKHSV